MGFYQAQVEEGPYYEVETSHGTEIIPADLVGPATTLDDLRDYLEGKPYDARPTLKSGWLYRLSAPGYMDATTWGVAESREQAYQDLLDQWGSHTPEGIEDWEVEVRGELGICPRCQRPVHECADFDGYCSRACRDDVADDTTL